MPLFDFRGIKAGKYNSNAAYSDKTTLGEAMNCLLAFAFAEGRLYAESSLAEYLKRATGGTLSIGTKYIPKEGQILLYGVETKTRTVNGKQIISIVHSTDNKPNYVGVGMYAPDMIDGEEKYTAFFIHRAMFGPPSWELQTQGETIKFATPTTSGEFMAKDKIGKNLLEFAICDTEEDAIAWIDQIFDETPPATVTNVNAAPAPVKKGGA